MDPLLLPRAAVYFVRVGWSLWVRWLGARRAAGVVGAGLALSTLAVLVVEGCDLA